MLLHSVLDHVYSADAFIGLSFAVRIVEALGSAAFLTASFAIVAAEFPDSVATTFVSSDSEEIYIIPSMKTEGLM